jgi:hypothetical protein
MSDPAAFQRRSTAEGRTVQEIAGSVLTGAGFENLRRNTKLSDCGVTANYIATDQHGDDWIFDVSGAFTAKDPGLIRSDTMWKTLGRVNVLHCLGYERVVILTTNLPPKGTVGDRALRAASRTFFDAVEMLPKEGRIRLEHYAKGGGELLPLPGYRTASELYEAEPLFGASFAVPADAVAMDISFSASKVVEMPHKIEVLVPTLDHEGNAIPAAERDAARKKLRAMLSKVAGGCTAQEATGSWIHPVEGEMQEGIYAIVSYSSEPFAQEFIDGIVSVVLDDLNQHTAAIIVNERVLQFESLTAS